MDLCHKPNWNLKPGTGEECGVPSQPRGVCAEEGAAGDCTRVNPHCALEYPGGVSASCQGHRADRQHLLSLWQIRDTS